MTVLSSPLEVFSGNTTRYLIPFPSWHDFLRMKTSSFHHLCQRSSLSPSCQRGRTGVWTLLWTSSGKKPGNGWWQQSARHRCDRTPPRKALTASRSTSPRPRPASESEPAPIIEKILTHFRHSLTQTHRPDLRRTHRHTTDAQRPIPHSSTADGRRKHGDHRAQTQSRIMQIITQLPWDWNNLDRCLILLLLLLLTL